MLKSRREFPPGGFVFRQPQTDWPPNWKTYWAGKTLEQVRNEVLSHRLANPRWQGEWSLDPEMIENEIDIFTSFVIMKDHPKAAPHYLISEDAAKKSPGLPQPQGAGRKSASAAGAGKYLANTTAGIGLYLEWFGSSGPVDRELAIRRSEICLKCPLNNTKVGIFQWFNRAAADQIMKVFGILKEMNLHLPREQDLGVCDPCSCPVRAKVFAPLDIILRHLRPEAKAGLDPNCWMTWEESKANEPTNLKTS